MEYGWDYQAKNQNRYNDTPPSVTGFRRPPLKLETHSKENSMSSDTGEVLAYVLQADGTMAAVRPDDNTALIHNPQIMAALRAEQHAQLHGETTGRIHSASGGNRKLSSGVIEALTTDRNSSTASTPPFSPSSGFVPSGSAFASPTANSTSRQTSQPRGYVPRATPTTQNQMNGTGSQLQMQTNSFSPQKPSVPPPQYSSNSENRSRFLYAETTSTGNSATEMNNNIQTGYKPTASSQINAPAVRKYQQNSSKLPPPVPKPSPEMSHRCLPRQNSEGQRVSPFQMFANNSQKQRAESSKTETWWINKLQNQQKGYAARRDEELSELNDIRPVRLRTRSKSQPRLRLNREDSVDSGFQRNGITVEYQPAYDRTPRPPTAAQPSTRSRTPRRSTDRQREVDTKSKTPALQTSAGLSIRSPSPPKESPKFQRQVSTENIQTSNRQKPRRRNSLKIVKKTSGEQIEVSASGAMQERGRGDIRSDLYASAQLHRARSVEPKSSRQKVLMENRNRMYERSNFYSDM